MQPVSFPVKIASIQTLPIKLEPVKISPGMAAQMEELWKNQFRIPLGKPDNHPDNIYATVKVGGKIVATLYNSGASVTENAAAGKLQNLPGTAANDTTVGPKLAQQRAEYIARQLGGIIEKAPTAQTASQWRPTEMEWGYDYEAMEAAKKLRDERIAQNISARTIFNAQLLGQQNT